MIGHGLDSEKVGSPYQKKCSMKVAFDFMLIVKDSDKDCSDLQWSSHELLPLYP